MNRTKIGYEENLHFEQYQNINKEKIQKRRITPIALSEPCVIVSAGNVKNNYSARKVKPDALVHLSEDEMTAIQPFYTPMPHVPYTVEVKFGKDVKQ